MKTHRNSFLLVGSAFSAAAAALHVACIFVGAPLYRFVGAGEGMARMAEAGHWYPTFAAAVIASILTLWSLYAMSGARIIPRLPLLRTALCVITAIYLIRGVAFQLLVPHFSGNGPQFWFWSSMICFTAGIVHLIGVREAWPELSRAFITAK